MKLITKTVMIALGGNALSPKAEAGTIDEQFTHTRNSLKGVMHNVKKKYNGMILKFLHYFIIMKTGI